jgi:P-aminobenzoate N-oxygenase AurF
MGEDHGMRARELRLRRTLRRLVMLALATPAPGVAACRLAESTEPPADASGELRPVHDAEISDAGDGGMKMEMEASDPCAPFSVDGAAFGEAPDACAVYRVLPCGLPDATQLTGCFPDLLTCAESCGGGFLLYCQLAPGTCDDAGVVPDAESVLECISCTVGGGRRPRGLRPSRALRRTPVGDYFAAVAHLESASVRAFRDLERWLGAFAAPTRLRSAASRAAADERRHARAVARLARRFGASPPRPRAAPSPSPSLFELIEDDVIEGCVGETFGALVATWQAERAGDPRVRRTMQAIARDETRHAALAWEIWRWGARLLEPADRIRLRQALDDALAALEQRVAVAVPEAVQRVAGHPSPDAARRLVHGLSRALHDEAARAS